MPPKVGDRLRKIVVIGGSQGAIEALLQIMPSLPPDLPMAVFVVVHIPIEANSYLPKILERASHLMVHSPKDGEPIRAGHVYVGPPDYHLTVEGQTVQVRKGPRENRHRPAIDPLFRSAARSFGANAIAVLLSGNLDDGAAGMLAVRHRGGIAIIQDPADAQVGEMPERALAYAGADYLLPTKEIAARLTDLVLSRDNAMKKSARKTRSARKRKNEDDTEIRENEEVAYASEGVGKPSVFACPECHGVLWELNEGRFKRYRCRVGHAYTPASLKTEMDQSGERALWAAMRALEEKAAMGRRMIDNAKGKGPANYVRGLKEQVEADTSNAHVIRKMIFASD